MTKHTLVLHTGKNRHQRRLPPIIHPVRNRSVNYARLNAIMLIVALGFLLNWRP